MTPKANVIVGVTDKKYHCELGQVMVSSSEALGTLDKLTSFIWLLKPSHKINCIVLYCIYPFL